MEAWRERVYWYRTRGSREKIRFWVELGCRCSWVGLYSVLYLFLVFVEFVVN